MKNNYELYTKEELISEIQALKDSKKYGLVWEEYTEEAELITEPNFVFSNEYSLAPETSDNPIKHKVLEGDNLLALKQLEKTHVGKIDVIYIDPPYNTGNEFVYNDKIVDKEDNFRHSKWLSFMSKRLKLAKKLLSEDGVIFVSIDDNEQAQLKLLMDEVFGEQNVETKIWQKVGTGASGGRMKITHRFRRDHEYIIVGYKNKEKVRFNRVKELPTFRNKYTNPDNDIRGEYKAGNMSKTEEKSSPNGKNYYTVTAPDGVTTYTRQWHFDKQEFERLDKDGRIYWGKNRNGVPQIKVFVNEERLVVASSLLQNKGSASTSNKEVNVDMKLYFDNPKPMELIKYLLELIQCPQDGTYLTVLDFFAGSGTTGHAVMELNKEDGGNRKFILCTNNEVSEEKIRQHFINQGLLDKNTKTAFKKFYAENSELVNQFYESEEYQKLGIARSVTYERLKRVIEGYTTPKGKFVEGLKNNSVVYFISED